MRSLALVTLACALLSGPAVAAGGAEPAPHQHWHFNGIGGTYDQAAMQRGLKVYREVCAACHSLKRINFRNLEDLGYEEGQIKNIAAEYEVTDGPDAEGEYFTRPARPSDRFPSPFANKEQAVAANGAFPPDLSLITKARHHGPDYVYALLTGYVQPEHGVEVPEGKHYNKYYPGHIITMAAPLADGQISYEDGSPETVEQYAYDIVNFLTWAADPYMEDRKRTGVAVCWDASGKEKRAGGHDHH